ncbi:MAG TPA: cation-translocating P-type ATPase [Anaerolineales bacterium]|nr:cation-translocating P-type ATPase [Anaerolineae bacterium]HIP87381.1 cation-translocating P-type ATPase [Anaerolineales bacterium]
MGQHEAWHTLSIEEAVTLLGTDLQRGLNTEEAQRRLTEVGPNELAERPRPGFWQILLNQFNSFLVWILIGAALISLVLGEIEETAAILAIVVLNAILGAVQERRAEEALAALRRMAAPDARVLRDGHRVTVPARELVPGDVVFLEAGNYVPADLRLVESVNLRIDEASLTGESVAVEKQADAVLPEETVLGDRVNCAFMGTTVTYGRGTGVVTDTGMQTQIGLIAEMIQSYEEEPTPLQRRLDQLGRWLGWATLSICGLVFVVAVIRDTDLGIFLREGATAYLDYYSQMVIDLFLTAVSLAIAAVPEGLPAVVTICLALGMREMIRRHALIRRLPAVETLGSATAICSDKTGTLTQNEMTAVRLYVANLRLDISGEGYQPEGVFTNYGTPVDPRERPEVMALLTGGLLCSDARLEKDEDGYRMVGDPTEGALVVAAAKAGLWREEVEARLPRVAEIPFDSDRKRMSTVHSLNGGRPAGTTGEYTARYVVYVKGAPDVVLPRCHSILEDGVDIPLTPARRQHIENVNRDLGREALRVLAVAYRLMDELPETLDPDEIERDLTLIGLIAMIDPARPEVRPAVEKARRAGIRTIMVTGDYPDTARAIAEQIGLLRPGGEVLTGAELNRLSNEELENRIERVDVFARVSPQHKVRIVEALKAHDHVVAMTGDGVNDAPALRRADIGIAMGITGTDVTKEVADMVLTDDNYASIVAAIEQGRIIYSNIRKFVYYLLSCNLAEIMVIFLAALAGQQPPLTPIQLLWLNLLTDGAPALALGLEKGEPDIMEQPPRDPKEPVINRPMVRGIVIQTIAITTVVLVAYLLGLRWENGHPQLAGTMAFVTLSASELLRAYTARSERTPLARLGLFTNPYMQYAVGASILLLLGAVYLPFLQPIFDTIPLGWREWAAIGPLLAIPALVAEINKWLLNRQRRGQQTG